MALLTAALAERYTVERELGSGGMATVYLAHDLKHDRKVALKVLRPELAAVVGSERFLHEIKVTANLQHPNILPFFDSGEADTFLYYVMPWVDGETLRDKLDREIQLGVEETLAIAKSVAAALQYAHERHVVHRDIKPENILLQSGQALVADFGIALAVSTADGKRLTETGLSIGTPNYMSPEQAAGAREITARSDVYSLGCLVYEMLMGEPPFTGPTVQAILSKVAIDRPRPARELRATVPVHVEAAVDTALEKVPADRFESAAAFAAALSDTGYRSAGIAPAARPVGASRRWKAAAFGVLGVAATASALLLAPWRGEDSRPLTQTPLTRTGVAWHPALSPDGTFLAYTSGLQTLLLGEADGGGTPRVLVDSAEYIAFPTWSPDGRDILFAALFAGGRGLYAVPRLGSAVRFLMPFDAPELIERTGYSYNPDGTEFVVTGAEPGTVEFVNLATLRPRSVTVDQDFDRIWRLAWSPDGRWLGLMAITVGGDVVVGIMSPEGHVTAREIFHGPPLQLRWSAASDALYHYQPDDEWKFVVRRVDSKSGAFRGDPEVLLQDVSNHGGPTGGSFDIDHTGTRLIYSYQRAQNAVVSVDLTRDPPFRTMTAATGWISPPAISPDGQTLAYPRVDHLGLNVYQQPFDGGPELALTAIEGAGASGNLDPAWSPAGGRVAVRVWSDTAPERLMTVTVPGGQIDHVPYRSWPHGRFAPVQFLSETRLLVSGPTGPGAYDLNDGSYSPLDLPDSLIPYLDPDPVGLRTARLSPDGRFAAADSTGVFHVGDWRTGTVRQVTRLENESELAVPIGWTDTGDIYAIVFMTWGEGQVWRVPAAGGSPRLVVKLDRRMECWSVSRNGRRMACRQQTGSTSDFWVATNFDPGR